MTNPHRIVAAIAALTGLLLAALPVTAQTDPPSSTVVSVGCTDGQAPFVAFRYGTDTRITRADGSATVSVGGTPLEWADDGRLLLATPFRNGGGFEMSIVEDTQVSTTAVPDASSVYGFDADHSGVLLGGQGIERLDLGTGEREVLLADEADRSFAAPVLSPDRSLVAVTVMRSGLSPSVAIWDGTAPPVEITPRLGGLRSVAWTVDGRALVVPHAGVLDVVSRSGSVRTIAQVPGTVAQVDVSPNGRDVYFNEFVSAEDREAGAPRYRRWVVGLDGVAPPEQLESVDGFPITGGSIDPTASLMLLSGDLGNSESLVDFWLRSARRGTTARLTGPITAPSSDFGPGRWAPVCQDRVRRLAGPTRVETAVEMSRAVFPMLAEDAVPVLVRSDEYADALIGAPLTRGRAPLLLTPPGELHPAVADELRRLAADRVVIIGDATMTEGMLPDQLAELGISVDVVGGADPFVRAAAAARRLDGERTLLVRGTGVDGWPDALSAGPWAARDGLPILLTEPDELPAATLAAARDRGGEVIIVGGEAAVSGAVQAELRDSGLSTVRVDGRTRYETSSRVLQVAFDVEVPTAWVATGANWPDALAVGAAAAQGGNPLILSPPTGLADAPEARFSLSADAVTLVGGPDVLSPAARDLAALVFRSR